MEMLVALPGCPTDFDDGLGATGYEEKTKNIFVQNRNALHNDWLAEKPFVKSLNDDLHEIMALRSHKELQPLNDGDMFVLDNQEKEEYMTFDGDLSEKDKAIGVLRQSPDGAMTISVIAKDKQTLKRLNLADLPGGLKIGTKFYDNILGSDKEQKEYIVCQDDKGKCILRRADGKDIEVDHTLILFQKSV